MPLRRRSLNDITGRRGRKQPANKFAEEFREFCDLTSAHGFPRISNARGPYKRLFWMVLLAAGVGAFSWQAYGIIEKFNRNEKIVSVELRFENINFPAVTICNLNPYKNSLARNSEGVQSMLSKFDEAMSQSANGKRRFRRHLKRHLFEKWSFEQNHTDSNDKNSSLDSSNKTKHETSTSRPQFLMQPVRSKCQCLVEDSECIPLQSLTSYTPNQCICYYNNLDSSLWPCYDKSQWSKSECADCSMNSGICSYPHESDMLLTSERYECLCQNISKSCIRMTDGTVSVWSPSHTTTESTPLFYTLPAADSVKSTIYDESDQLEFEMSNGRWLVQPMHSACECNGKNVQHCKPKFNQPINDQSCVCIYDSHNKGLWPCASTAIWEQKRCDQCSSYGYCAYPLQSVDDANYWNTACLCQRLSYFCVAINDVPPEIEPIDALPKVWHQRHKRDTMNDKRHISKRQSHALVPALIACDCGYGVHDCRPNIDNPIPTKNDTVCLCFFNHADNNHVWPCYPRDVWKIRKCNKCVGIGSCEYVPERPPTGYETFECICVDVIKICLRLTAEGKEKTKSTPTKRKKVEKKKNATTKHEVEEIIDIPEEVGILKIWELTTTTEPPTTSTDDPLGFSGMKDKVAIITQAKENLLFEVAKMNFSQKSAMSYTKTDLIKKCVFNGKECSIENDFKLMIDPTFGNCYTFNYQSNNLTSDRAGPSYGLRVEAFVDTSEYLPTTEASGLRITVHPQDEQPFPDTVGFSAPTGAISSFGVHLKKIERLPAPYGDCVLDGKTEDFIYRDKIYSVEGCHTSCIQHFLVSRCDCGDPRFPPVRDKENCEATDPEKRKCLKDALIEVAIHLKAEDNCPCKQPCSQLAYTVTYSASKWPAGTQQLDNCPDYLKPMECLEYFRNQGLMVEIFFEQLNYEYLKETEAYGWPNLLSDFGGQLGLWMGVSVITCVELVVLMGSVLTACCIAPKRKWSERKNGLSSKTFEDENRFRERTSSYMKSSIPGYGINNNLAYQEKT